MEDGTDLVMSPTSASQNPKLQLPVSCDPPGPQNPSKQLVWVVFGATGHMGRSVVKAALAHNDLVTAVGRTFEHSLLSMRNWTSSPSQSSPVHCLGLLCDVRVRETVDDVIKKSIKHWGRIDIIANCSGYGVIGACEDQEEYEIRNQFETNFWGTLNIIQLSLGYFRSRPNGEGGRYLIFSSTSGALGVPGLGPYCATKYAVEGLIESMLYEIDAFNIKATLVEPGHVRRDEPDSKTNPLPTFGHFFIKPASEPYSGATAPAGHAKRMVQWLGDNQPTSAVKAAELVWQLGHCSFPPLRLLLGSYAVESVRDRLRSIIEEIEDWKHLSFPSGADGAVVKQEDKQQEIKEENDDRYDDGREDDEMQDGDEGDGDQDGESHDHDNASYISLKDYLSFSEHYISPPLIHRTLQIMTPIQAVVGRGPFSFFWLPVEIRRFVYLQLLSAERDLINHKHVDPFRESKLVYVAILSTCRKIYDEAIPVLYGNNLFGWRFDSRLLSSRPSTPPLLPRLYGDLNPYDLLKDLEFAVRLEDLSSSSGAVDGDAHELIRKLNRTDIHRGIVKIVLSPRSKEYSTYREYADLTNPLLQAVRNMTRFKKVLIGLPLGMGSSNKKSAWSPVLTRELESGLGPNVSSNRTSLEFLPQNQPPNWIRQNVPYLMRLPDHIRKRIIGMVIGEGPLTYPSEVPGYPCRNTDWRLVPNVRGKNPSRDLSLLRTCEKLWEESWMVALNTNFIFFDFDFSDSVLSYENLARLVPLHVSKVGFKSYLNDNRFRLLSILEELREPLPLYEFRRRHLILRLGILQPNTDGVRSCKWRRKCEGENYRKYYDEEGSFTYEEVNETPFINGIYGHDVRIGKALQWMNDWEHMDVELMPITLKNDCWRHDVTRWLEKSLGPNLSRRHNRLCFRPRYYWRLLKESQMVDKDIAYFMRQRKYFSEDAMDDVGKQVNEDSSPADQNGDHTDHPTVPDQRSVYTMDSNLDHDDDEEENDEESDDAMSSSARDALDASEEPELHEALSRSASLSAGGRTAPGSSAEIDSAHGEPASPGLGDEWGSTWGSSSPQSIRTDAGLGVANDSSRRRTRSLHGIGSYAGSEAAMSEDEGSGREDGEGEESDEDDFRSGVGGYHSDVGDYE
ncbi:hypothetical protein MMC13_001564 [Lambiella insularis]|nr:hypothetical protein [Lambiella insularis]